MLILTRRPGDRVLIGDDIVVVIMDIVGDRVRIGIDAPDEVTIARAELMRNGKWEDRRHNAHEME